MDHTTDTSKGIFNLVKQAVTAVDIVKVAEASDMDVAGLPSSSFGDPSGRRFPVHTPEDAILSAAYAAYHKEAAALDRIYQAGKIWGNEDTLRKIAAEVQAFEQPVKYALDLAIGGTHYTLFPYSCAENIKEAAEAFYENRHKLPWAAREKTASVLFEEILGYGGNDAAKVSKEAFEYITKAAGYGLPDLEVADAMLCQRWIRKDKENPAFPKVARILREIRDDPAWDKVAMEAFDALDGEVGLKEAYGKALRLPEEDLYVNSVLTAKTAAEQGIVRLMNGRAIKLDDVDWTEVAQVDPVLYKEAQGGIKAAEVLPTWPRPDADLLVEMLSLPLVEA